MGDLGRMSVVHSVTTEAQEAASFDVHYGLLGVFGNCVSLGQIQATGGTCPQFYSEKQKEVC